MSKLYCEYDHGNPKTEIANHICDFCGKLLCKICGYNKDGKDYCNECWVKEIEGRLNNKETLEEKAERIKRETAYEEEIKDEIHQTNE